MEQAQNDQLSLYVKKLLELLDSLDVTILNSDRRGNKLETVRSLAPVPTKSGKPNEKCKNKCRMIKVERNSKTKTATVTVTPEPPTTPPPGLWTINEKGYAVLNVSGKQPNGTWFMSSSGNSELLPNGRQFPPLPQGGKWIIESGNPKWVVKQNPTITPEPPTTPPPGSWTINEKGYAVLNVSGKQPNGTWFINSSGNSELLPNGRQFPPLPQGGKWIIKSGNPKWVFTQNPTIKPEQPTTPPPGSWTINEKGYAVLNVSGKQPNGTWFMNSSGNSELLPNGRQFPPLPQGGKWIIESGNPKWVVTQNPTIIPEPPTTLPPGSWTINEKGYAVLNVSGKQPNGTWFMNSSGNSELLPNGRQFPPLPQGGKWIIESGNPKWVVTQNPTIIPEPPTTLPPGSWTINEKGYAVLNVSGKQPNGTWFMNSSGNSELLPNGRQFPPLPQGGKWIIESGNPKWVFTQNPTIKPEPPTTPPPGSWTINEKGYAVLNVSGKQPNGTWFMNSSGNSELLPNGRQFPPLPQGGKWIIESGNPKWVVTQNPTIIPEPPTTPPPGSWTINEKGYAVLNVSGKQPNGTWFMNSSGNSELLPNGRQFPPLPQGGKWIIESGIPKWDVTQNPTIIPEQHTTPPPGWWTINEKGYAVLNVYGKQPNGTWFMNSSGNSEFLPNGRQFPPLPQGGKWTIESGSPKWDVKQNPTIIPEQPTTPPPGWWTINEKGYAVLNVYGKQPNGTWFMNSSGNSEFLPNGRQFPPLPQGGKWTIESGSPKWDVKQNPTIIPEQPTTPPPGWWTINEKGYAVLNVYGKQPNGTWFMNSSGNSEFLPNGRQFPPLPQGGKWTIESGSPKWDVKQNPTIIPEQPTTPPPGWWTINENGYAVLNVYGKQPNGTWIKNSSGNSEFLPNGRQFPPLPQGGKWTIESGSPKWDVKQNPTITPEQPTTPPPGWWTINANGYSVLNVYGKPPNGTWFMNSSGNPEFVPNGRQFPPLPQGGKWTITSSGSPKWVITQNPTITPQKPTNIPPGEWIINQTGHAVLNVYDKKQDGTWFMNASGYPEFLEEDMQLPPLRQGGQWKITLDGRPQWLPTQKEQTTPPPGQWIVNDSGYAVLNVNGVNGIWFMNAFGYPELLPNGKQLPLLPQGGHWKISSDGKPIWVPMLCTEGNCDGSVTAQAISTSFKGDANAVSLATSVDGSRANAISQAITHSGSAFAESTLSSRRYTPKPTRAQMPPKVVDGYFPSTSLQETYPIDSNPAIRKVYQDIHKTLKDIDECVSKIMYKLDL
ncbi:uncharacterized protein LOC128988650 [Macrosteles quadrilineatus]|uniref:uncharacterized protein LOC128988650 n=1 Tax=Macrosteles quadrilineatus TaxID=74068 RepID=UPI0023E14F4A|nr:uncharacterized protein LOC128988650 [Macrosteles quadrilineatus]